MLKAMFMAVLGLFLGTIGIDLIVGKPRFTFGVKSFMDGVGLIPVVMGLFGISEVLLNVEEGFSREVFKTRISNLFPSLKDWKDSVKPIFSRNDLGIFPGNSSWRGGDRFRFYFLCGGEKVIQAPGEVWLRGHRRVAGPETANNAGSSGAFVLSSRWGFLQRGDGPAPGTPAYPWGSGRTPAPQPAQRYLLGGRGEACTLAM